MRWLFAKALALMKKNIDMDREIDDGKDIIEVARKHDVKSIDSDFQPVIERKWWLESLFEKFHLSFNQGTLLVYTIVVLPAVFFLPYILQSSPREFQIGYFASYIGAMTVLVVLIPLRIVHNGLSKLAKQINENIGARFVAPVTLIRKEDLSSSEDLRKLDMNYRILYVKPIVFKTLQFGYDLSFDKRYQIGAGIIASAISIVVLLLRYGFNIIPPSVLNFWAPIAIPEVAAAWMVYTIFVVAFLWFLVGMLAWSLFIAFMVALQTSAQAIEIRPFEPLREVFYPTTSLVLKTSFALTAIVAWASPYILVWGLLPQDPLMRQSPVNFVEVALVVLIPVIILSLAVPFLTIHKGMDRSRERALRIKWHKLEELRKNPIADFDMNLKIQTHLMDDFKRINENPEWPLSATQVLEVVGTVLLPIVTFLLSRLP